MLQTKLKLQTSRRSIGLKYIHIYIKLMENMIIKYDLLFSSSDTYFYMQLC